MVHAALTRLITATALVLAIARNPQWASFSVASFSTSTSRPCSAGFAGGNGSRLYDLPVGACSSIHAANPAASSAGICASDRKSVVEGKSVDLGGRRIIKKKKKK